MSHAILLVDCEDRTGLVAALSQFVHVHGGNIVDADQHTEELDGRFYMRLKWSLAAFDLNRDEVVAAIAELADEFQMQYRLLFDDHVPHIAVFCGKEAHCVHDLLIRQEMGELAGRIVHIISNHPDLEALATKHNIPFTCIPVSKDNKAAAEAAQQALLKQHAIETVVLARYMQVLSPSFVDAWQGNIINIHHSFLPAFAGAKPYHQAKQRGVKIIGATAHYVTSELDEGPIIEQNVCRVSHRDTVADLIRKGRDLERQVLAGALRLHLQHRVLPIGNRTIVFA